MSIPALDSKSLSADPARRRRVLLATGRLLLIAAWFGLAGCSSIYRRTWAKVTPQPGDELKVRVQEAQEVERLTRQAGVKLRADLEQQVSGEIIQADFDRLEMLARELRRRLLVARDVTAKAGTGASPVAECERLQRCATSWLQYVEAARHADVAAQAAQLDEVLLGFDEGSASSIR